MNDTGFIYILKNECMPHYYKIGLTRGEVSHRIFSLRSTGLPKDFVCVSKFQSEHVAQLERHIHKSLNSNRVNQKREFFFFDGDTQAKEAVSAACKTFKVKPYTKKEVKELDLLQEGDTPSRMAKSLGCVSLTQVANATEQSLQTLTNWYRNKPELFRIVCIGVAIQSSKPDNL